MLGNIVRVITSPFATQGRFVDKAERHQKVVQILYEKHADAIFHFLLTISTHATAQDISQQLWLKLLENPDIIKRQNNFVAYMFTAARNAVIDEYKRNNRLTELDTSSMETSSIVHSENIDDVFDNALCNLPFYQREAFCLQQEGFSLQEIANITHTEKETVKTRLRYARSQLQQSLAGLYPDSTNVKSTEVKR